jgi:dTDP-glucose 4,6-dehydratase
MKTNILLTGSSGFIGSNLIKALRKERVSHTTIPHSMLKDPKVLEEAIELSQPTVIIHMASYGNLASQNDEDEIIQANYTNLYNLLQASKSVQYEMFINFSSSSVSLPHETFYSATKAAGERLCGAFATKYMKQIVSVRPYTVIGPGEPDEHLIPTLIRSCLEGTPMPFVREPVHDFIGVNDFVSALKLIIEGWHLKGEIQIGTGVKTSNQEILEIVERVTGAKANISRVDNLRKYDNLVWQANPAIIKSLGWKQKETIEDVIVKMVRDYERRKATTKGTRGIKKA